MNRFRFTRAERLTDSASIQLVFRKGKKYSCEGAKLFVLVNGMQRNRIVFTFPRGFGTAVERNYSRRLSREVYRLNKHCIQTGFDFCVLIFPGKDTYAMRESQLQGLFKKAGVWMEQK